MNVVELVVAGGRASRFGGDRALAVLDDHTVIASVVDVLAAGCEAVAVNAGPQTAVCGWAAEHGLPVLPDRAGAGRGRLAGVLAGIAWATRLGADLLATAPCDTSFLLRDMVGRLRSNLRDHQSVAVALTETGLQPLCALWRVPVRQDLRELCESGGVRPVRTALIQLGVTMVPFPQESAFAKVPPYGGAVQVPRIVQLPQRVGVTYAGPAGFKYLSRNKLNCRARTEDVTRDG